MRAGRQQIANLHIDINFESSRSIASKRSNQDWLGIF